MKKQWLALLLCLVLLASSACTSAQNGGGTEAGTTAAPTEAPTAAPTEAPTEAPTAAPTQAETKPADPTAPTVLDVVWNFGYVGSATHSTQANKLVPRGGYYSYTDVIVLEKAGTRITFRDDNSHSNGDSAFASGNAYVISSWHKSGSGWVLDLDGANYAGTGNGASDVARTGSGYVEYSYVSSKDNEGIRLCYRSGQTATFTPDVWPKVTVQYTGEPGTAVGTLATEEDFQKYLSELRASAGDEALKGLTLYAIGDSYFAGNGIDPRYVWPNLLAEKYGMNFTNKGINGSSVSAYDTTHNPMVNRVNTLPAAQPDIILFEGGKNDFNVNCPIGTDDDRTSVTFKGALNLTLDKLEERYPNALILCVTPWKVNGTNSLGLGVSAYTTAMREVCAKRGIACFNAADPALSGVDMTNASFRASYCMGPSDVSHLNLEGFKLVLPKFEQFISDSWAAFRKGA